MSIDWTEAPDQATHYDCSADVFCTVYGYWSCKGTYYHMPFQTAWGSERYTPRPVEQSPTAWPTAWNGTGLPPVGMECEVVIAAQKPRTVCFVGIKSSGSVVIETVDGELKSYHRSQVNFRPVRTQAQREREEIIIDALRHVDDPRDDEVHPRQYFMDALHTLYDAGMLRKEAE